MVIGVWLVALVTGKVIGRLIVMSYSDDRRLLHLEEKVSQLEDRMDRYALGLTNKVIFERGPDIVVRSNSFITFPPGGRLFHADGKR